jgi:hypothetical protein
MWERYVKKTRFLAHLAATHQIIIAMSGKANASHERLPSPAGWVAPHGLETAKTWRPRPSVV